MLKVEQPCPQCGAPVTLEESDRLFSCGHCRVRLYLSGGRAPRYFLPPAGDGDFLFVPYWHFRGASFTVLPGDITTRFLDKTMRAAGPDGLPLTLGVRTQAMTLRRAARDMKGRFLEPVASGDEALARAEAVARSFGGVNRRPVHTAFVGEARSLVYAPLCERDGALWDAVLDRRQAALPGEGIAGPFEDSSSWRTTFLPALCPECGWDLPGERRSVVLVCRRCSRSWASSRGRWLPVKTLFAGGQGANYFPVWELRVGVDGVGPGNFTSLPAASRAAWREGEFRLRVPAFAIRPRVLMRLAAQLTGAPLEQGVSERVPEGEIRSVTLGREDALAMAGVVLALLAVPKRDVYALLPGLKPGLRSAAIVYLPFDERAGDFVLREGAVSFRKNALRS